MGIQKQIKKITFKHYVFIFFCATLFFPLIQQHTKIIKEKPLQGFFNIEDYPTLNWEKWSTGEYQKQFETASNDNVGFHDFFVELQSQLNYSIYNISKIQSVVVGKEGYLYVRNYIDAVNGNDFMGSAYINLQIEKAKVVDSVLKSKNIDLLFAIAPGKGSYFPEYIPDVYKNNKYPDSTNYACYKKAFSISALNFIDLREYFLKIKDTCKYPVFSQVGVHWGEYACSIAAQQLIKEMEKIKKIKIAEIKITDLTPNDNLISYDKDALSLMNMFETPKFYSMPTPTIKCEVHNQQKLLSISDSYFSNIVPLGIIDQIFPNYEYWIYGKKDIPRTKLVEAIESKDIILIMATDATLSKFPYSFIDSTYEIYAPKNVAYYKLKQKEFICFTKSTLNNLSKDKKWRKMLMNQATKKGIKPEEEFVNNAIWLYYNQ